MRRILIIFLLLFLVADAISIGWTIHDEVEVQKELNTLQEERVILYDFIDELDNCKSMDEVFYLRDSLRSELQFLDE